MSQHQTVQSTKNGTSNKSTKAKSRKTVSKKKRVRKALSPEEIKDLELDPVEDKETIEALSQDQEINEREDVLGDIEPVALNKNVEPKAKKAEKIAPKVDLSQFEAVIKTENDLQDKMALAKMNKVKRLVISDKLMQHFNRFSDELPHYFWYQGCMLVLEGKVEEVEKRLKSKVM